MFSSWSNYLKIAYNYDFLSFGDIIAEIISFCKSN